MSHVVIVQYGEFYAESTSVVLEGKYLLFQKHGKATALCSMG